MTYETMTFPQVLRQMAENVEAGREATDGIQVFRRHSGDWVQPVEVTMGEIMMLCDDGSVFATEGAEARAEAERRLFGKEVE